jgi:DNA-3-methyladenine glycosylase II
LIGITWQKARYIHDLAVSIRDGELDLDALAEQAPEQARESLLEVRGIGPWTADAYLLSALRLPDVFPIGDRALQVGMTELLGMTRLLFPDDMEFHSRPWRPLRAVAARIIWHAYLSKRGRVEPPDPTVEHASETGA